MLDATGRLWAIDNALTFHKEPKLRTVIWDFAGQPLPEAVLTDLEALVGIVTGDSQLVQALEQLLTGREVAAIRRRLLALIESRSYPEPGTGRVVPWPLV